jgi:hypothetical protein
MFIQSEEFFQSPQSIVEKIGEVLGEVPMNYERLKGAITVSKPYGEEGYQDRERLLVSIMEQSAFET